MSSPRTLSLNVFVSVMIVQQTFGALCFPIAKYGLAIIPPFTFAFFRFVLASVVLLLLSRTRSRQPAISPADRRKIWFNGAIIIWGNQAMYLWGQSLTSASHGSILFATTPIWVFLFAIYLLKEKLDWRRAVGTAVALVGALSIILSGAIVIGHEYLIGDFIVLISVWSWAAYMILSKPLVEKYGAIRVTAYSLAAGAVLFAPFGAYRALQFDYSQSTVGAWLGVVYMAIGSSVISYVLLLWVLKHISASRVAVYQNIQPVIATAVAFVTLGERPELSFFVGGAIVLAGVLITEIGNDKSGGEAALG
jgi:drug/metabolite transporter (DMT)-like permease